MATQKQIDDAKALVDSELANVTIKKEKVTEIGMQINTLQQQLNLAVADVKKAEARLEIRREDLAALQGNG